MQFNKKYVAILSIGALLGTAGAVAMQTHAQQTSVSKAAPAPAVTSADKVTPQDTDNIQDLGNVEKPDAPDSQAEVKDANDNQAGDQDATPDNGKDDQSEASSTSTTK